VKTEAITSSKKRRVSTAIEEIAERDREKLNLFYGFNFYGRLKKITVT
jgi:hypothetical protein